MKQISSFDRLNNIKKNASSCYTEFKKLEKEGNIKFANEQVEFALKRIF